MDYSDANFNFVFPGAAVSHTTGVPYKVSDMPDTFTGKNSYKHVVQNEVTIKKYLKESVLARAKFGASNFDWLKGGIGPVQKKAGIEKQLLLGYDVKYNEYSTIG